MQNIGVPSTINEKAVDKVSTFMQTMCYSRMEDESVIETKVRIYKQFKTKTSQSKPPDKNSMLQVIKRIHYQLYYWLRSDIAVILETDLSENGWMIVDQNFQPVWFVGKRLSPNFFSYIKQI